MHEHPSTQPATSTMRATFDAAWDASDGLDADSEAMALFFDLTAWRPWLESATELLDDVEHARVIRKVRAGDREELALTYALHRLVLGRVLRREPARVPLGRDAVGRPCLPGDDVHTSLSHADGIAAIAVSRRGVIGIDVERATRAAEMAEIAEQVWHPDEAGAFAALPAMARWSALLGLWVRKEALLKAAGIGLVREMNTFPAPADREIALPVAGGGLAIIRMLDIGPAWVAAAAGVDMPPNLPIWLRPRDDRAL